LIVVSDAMRRLVGQFARLPHPIAYKKFSKHFKFLGHMNMTGQVFPAVLATLIALENRPFAPAITDSIE
jgi:hypothetical protein